MTSKCLRTNQQALIWARGFFRGWLLSALWKFRRRQIPFRGPRNQNPVEALALPRQARSPALAGLTDWRMSNLQRKAAALFFHLLKLGGTSRCAGGHPCLYGAGKTPQQPNRRC